MNERPRHREVLGRTASVCPDCGSGPMVVTRSWRRRRALDLLNPRFDPDVVHREVCTACSARFPIGADRAEAVLVTPRSPGGADGADGVVSLVEGAAASSPEDAASAPSPSQAQEESRATDDVVPYPEPATGQQHAAVEERADDLAAAWGGAPGTAPTPVVVPHRSRPAGRRSSAVGAGRRSGPARRPVRGDQH